MGITKTLTRALDDGREAVMFEMANGKGMCVSVTNVGCAIMSLRVPDKDGRLRDVALGFDTPERYTENKVFLGVVAGRVANRINQGAFTLDGNTYQLEKNDGGVNHLHGGSQGFNKKLWDAEVKGESIEFTLKSPDGDSGYPGALTARVVYTLTENNSLRIDYFAETDTKTICNLTNHSYFNLEGHAAPDIYGHELQINARHTTAVDERLIPTGALKEVAGTAYDFRQAKPIGQDIQSIGAGYDDNFVLDGPGVAATARAPKSGITMTVKTNSPGMQLYTGNFLDGSVVGKGDTPYRRHCAFCLETQLYPDAINQPSFPSCVVEKGKPQRFYTEFCFS